MEAPAVAYQILLPAGDFLLATGDLGSHPSQCRKMFRIEGQAEMKRIETLPCPSVMEQGKLAQGCRYQDTRPSEGNIRREVVDSEVTDNEASGQNLLQAHLLDAKVGCLGVHPIALKDLSRLKDQLHYTQPEKAWSL
jgi:hypothetical protein